jgi:hypothetical protein
MSLPLWMTIEPLGSETRLMLTEPSRGTVLKARLPASPAHPHAVRMLLESISLWYGAPLHAAVDADASDVRHNPERWSRLLHEAQSVAVSVEWVHVPERRPKDEFLAPMGDFARARRLVRFTATGQR